MPEHPMEQFLNPKSIAVVGASENPSAMGYDYLKNLIDFDFKGKVYPINPRAATILGFKAYPSIKDAPEPVDYVICCIPSPAVLAMVDDCAQNGVKAIHLYTGRFSETGHAEDANLEKTLLNKARQFGIRLIGPNCMGLYAPGAGISFMSDLPKESGPISVFSHSGGGSGFFVHMAALRGIRFNKVVSGGNSIDLKASDFLDYFAQDPKTDIILMYLETVKDGNRFMKSLKNATSVKPVVILKGGREQSGMRAAASHTSALAGSMRVWDAAIAQGGAITARSFDELADLAVSFRFLPRMKGTKVGICGGGGGHSVLGADECEEGGLEVIPLPQAIKEELKGKGVPIWDWINNPVDTSIVMGTGITGDDMIQIMAKNPDFDLLIAIINEHTPRSKEMVLQGHKDEVAAIIKANQSVSTKPLLSVLSEKSLGIKDLDYWRWRDLSEIRTHLIEAGIPTYPTTERAARAAKKVFDYYFSKNK